MGKSRFDGIRALAAKNKAAAAIVQGMEKALRGAYSRILWQTRRARIAKAYLSHQKDCFGMPAQVYKDEYAKYSRICRENPEGYDVRAQMDEFFRTPLLLHTDRLTLSSDACVPTVLVVVKDELDRMKLFFEHYRRLGVRQFIVLDNGSTDGTLEWIARQDGTRLYQVREPFQTQKKEAWIEKALATTGYGHWYIVVDSDELLDFTGSETHSAEELICLMHGRGYRRLWGFMLDMYSDQPVFSLTCEYQNIPKHFSYFDKESYILTSEFRKSCNSESDCLHGGPRLRQFGTDMVQSKQAIFYYDKDVLYRNCHFLQPIMRWTEAPCCFVLRHYKFLAQDQKVYRERVNMQNFAGESGDYQKQLDSIEKNASQTLKYENSVFYESSDSLRCLPHLTAVDWK